MDADREPARSLIAATLAEYEVVYATIRDYNGNPYAAYWGEKRL